jgi:hypothetical protein
VKIKQQRRLLHQLNSALQVTAHSVLPVDNVRPVANAAVVVADVFNDAANSANSVQIKA